MSECRIKVNAKINLALDIVGTREDGYHLLDMLMTSVDIYDIIHAKKSSKNNVTMDGKVVNEQNTALKALNLLTERYGIHMNVDIVKGIPFCSGMGGSSADASGVFYCAYKLFGLHIDDMFDLALKVGCDVPYMIYGGDARVQGVGEEISPLAFPDYTFVIAQSRVGASTKDIYKAYDQCGGQRNSDINTILADIDKNFCTYNVLEKGATMLCPDIVKAKNQLLKFTDKVFMTGSGSAYVGIFEDIQKAEECIQSLDGMIFKALATSKKRGIEELKI